MYDAMFSRPEGWRGALGGRIMAARGADVNRWAVSLLKLRQLDQVIEVGCGPGRALEAAAEQVIAGRVVGIDASPVMVEQAVRRNARAIGEGHVEVRLASAENLPFDDHAFTGALSVNSIRSWRSQEDGLWELSRVLEPGAKVVIAVRSRRRTRNPIDPSRWGYTKAELEELEALFVSVGFRFMRREIRRDRTETTVAFVLETVKPEHEQESGQETP